MQNSEQFDVSTLSWIKDEIDETLNQARIALESFVDEEGELAHLHRFIDLLHQVDGTLHIVEITGAARFAAEVESLATKIAEGEIAERQQGFDLLMRSILLLPDYLESMLGGEPDDSNPLIPLLNESRKLKGEAKLNPFQYFLPDLKVLPPEDFGNRHPTKPIKSVANKIHPPFQSALLNILHDKDVIRSISKLSVVLEKFSQYAVSDDVRQLIWVSMALVDALKNGQLKLKREHKGVLGKIEQVIKIIAQSGEEGVSKKPLLKLIKTMLWHISKIEQAPETSLAGQIQQAFQLGAYASPERRGVALPADLKRAVSNDIQTELTVVKDTFDLFVRSEQRALNQLEPMAENINQLIETLGLLEQEKLQDILRSQVSIIQKLISGKLEADEDTLMGVAGALLIVESSMKEWGSLNLMEQADASNDQVGHDLAQVEYQKMVRQAMQEACEDLIQVREAIIHYLEQGGNREVLHAVPELLREIIGSLKLLSYSKLAAILASCYLFIEERMIRAETMPTDDELNTLADAVMAVEYYLEAFSQSKVYPGKVLGVAKAAVAKLGYPADEKRIIELTPTAIDISESDETDWSERSEELLIEPEDGTTAVVAAEPAAVVEAAVEEEREIDDEIIEIFIEEAQGEISNLIDDIPKWQAEPANSKLLANIGRSFHTLKGSGRLVGATTLGEFSWVFERLVNQMIDGVFSPNLAIFDLLEQTLEALPQLIAQFKDGTQPTIDIESLQSFASEIAESGLIETGAGADRARDVPVLSQESVEVVEGSGSGEAKEDRHIDPVLLEIYESETEGHLEEVRQFLDEAEDSGNLLVKEPLVRALHTLTGSSRMANVPEVAECCSLFEKYLKSLQLTHTPISDEGIALLSYSLTYIDQVVGHLRDPAQPLPDPQELREKAALLYAGVAEQEEAEHLSPEAGLISTPEVEEEVEEEEEKVGLVDEDGEATIPSQIEPPDHRVPPIASIEDEESSDGEGEEDAYLIDIFLEEAAELIDATEETLQEWSDHPDDPRFVKSLQRQLHTLKGGARLVGIKEIGDLSHSLETIFDAIVDGLLQRTPEMFNLLQLAHDRLVTQLEQVRHHQPLSSGDDLIARVNALTLGEYTEPEAALEQPPHEAAAEEAAHAAHAAHVAQESTPPIELSPDVIDAIATLQIDFENWLAKIDDEVLTAELIDKITTLKNDKNLREGSDSLHKLLEAIERLPKAVQSGTTLRPFENRVLIDSIFESMQTAVEGKETPKQSKLNRELIDKIEQLLELEQPNQAGRESKPAKGVEQSETGEAEAATDASQELTVATQADTDEQRRRSSREQHEMVRVRADLLDELVNFAGEVSIYRSRVEQQIGGFSGNLGELDQTVVRLREQLRHLDIETEAQIDARYHDNVDRFREDNEEFDPLEFDRFTTMQQLSRSMAESLNDLQNIENSLANLSRETEALLLQQSRVNSELQDSLIQTRMMPLVEHAPRLRRVVRQTASELEKSVNLQFTGAEVEMDRGIVTRILAPLEHMLRNSVAHGIESTAQRKKAKKPQEGVIEIKLFQEGAEIVMLISDDGAGINKSAIVKKAIKQGLMKKGDKLSDQEIYDFILESGFSTADKLSQISGRGVGMSVVVSEVKQLGGSFAIDSEQGVGTTFSIRLPLSLTASRALLIKAADHQYAVPLLSVRGIERIEHARLIEVMQQKKPIYQWVDGEYELHYLSELIGFGAGGTHSDMIRRPLLMVQGGELRMALIVDVLYGSREIVVKSLGTQLSVLPEFSGASIMGDGSVVLILDIPALLRRSTQKERELKRERVVEPTRRAEPVIMVVDDSITVRKVTERLLKKQRLQCVTAKDGVDALHLLESVIPDVMLLDIEMPRMDGYELATNMRNSENEAIRKIPIIMITSRTGEKHHQRAMDIGVDAYLGKPYVEAELMEHIHHYLPEEIKERIK